MCSKEVRFLDEKETSQSHVTQRSPRDKLLENTKIMRRSSLPTRPRPPPPPQPPQAQARTQRSSTPPPPPPPPRNSLKKLQVPPPPPPPPPPPSTQNEGRLQQNFTTLENSRMKKIEIISTKIDARYLSPFTRKDSCRKSKFLTSDAVLKQPDLTIVSPLSGITNTTDFNSPSSRKRSTIKLDTTLSTFNTIDMLNFDYIENCNCLEDLERSIRILDESKNKSTPRLLEAAKKRYRDISGKCNQADKCSNLLSSEKEELGKNDLNLSRITIGNSTLESIDPAKSSLNFSYSPSSTTLNGLNLLDSPKVSDSYIIGSVKGREDIDRRLRPILELPVTLKDNYLSPLQKEERGQPGKGVPKVRATTEEVLKLQKSLKLVKHEHEESVKRARIILSRKDDETRALEDRLEARIADLTQVLTDTAHRSKLIAEGERTYRKQCEEELVKENKENTRLHHQLRETHDHFLSLQRRHSSFRIALLQATGISTTNRRNLSEQEFVSSLSKKIKSLKEENDSMTETLKQSKRAVQERNDMEVRMNNALLVKENLVLENHRLCKIIQELRAEVKSSRAYIDKLLKISNETKEEDWEIQEQQYKQVIQNLRKQVRKQCSTVSIDLYKAEKNKAKDNASQLRNAVNTIDNLNAKVEVLKKKTNRTKAQRLPKQLGHDENRDLIQPIQPKTPKVKSQDNLIGSTITITINNSPVSRGVTHTESNSPRSGERFQRQLGVKPTKTTTRKNDESNETNAVKEKSSTRKEKDSISHCDKENSKQTSYLSSLNKGSTKQQRGQMKEIDNNISHQYGMRNSKFPLNSSSRVKRFGGRVALQEKIKNMRSPKISSRLQLIVH